MAGVRNEPLFDDEDIICLHCNITNPLYWELCKHETTQGKVLDYNSGNNHLNPRGRAIIKIPPTQEVRPQGVRIQLPLHFSAHRFTATVMTIGLQHTPGEELHGSALGIT